MGDRSEAKIPQRGKGRLGECIFLPPKHLDTKVQQGLWFHRIVLYRGACDEAIYWNYTYPLSWTFGIRHRTPRREPYIGQWNFIPFDNISRIAFILFSLVSVFFEVCNRQVIAYLLALLRLLKNLADLLSFDKASIRSSGMVITEGESYAIFHLPSAFAASASLIPEGLIRHSFSRRITFSIFLFDHTLLTLRGVNRCKYDCSSKLLSRPSIQPKHNASSRA